MKRDVFPVRYYAQDMGTWVNSPELALSIWHRLRLDINRFPRKLIWYAVDMEVLSPGSVNLFVYEMADSFSGGIGKKIYEETITEFTVVEEIMLQRLVEGIYTSAAEDELLRREDEERMKKILEIRKEMFGV